METSEIRTRFRDLTIWTRGSERAPHKPLLLLYALGHYSRGGDRLIPYGELEPDLERLLFEFGPPRKSYHPEYPFWRLQNDGVWEVRGVQAREGGDVRVSDLRENNAAGGMREEVFRAVTSDPELLGELAHLLLDAHFADTYHPDICDAVGIGDFQPSGALPRDPDFRPRVLTAYEHRCAVCGWDLRLGDVLIGVEAAHIQWHQARGPAVVQNGLALCSLHHKLFDRGVFSLSDGLAVTVSERAHGSSGLEEALLRFHSAPIREPVNPEYRPGEEYLEWHRREVFQGPGRG